jgi:hypothetical protein
MPGRGAALILAIAWIANAASTGIDITAQVDRAEITVGDPVRYEITVTTPAGARVELPAVRGNTGGMEVTGYAVRTDTAPGGRAAVTHALTLAAYAVGADTLPPQRVEIVQPPDTAVTVLYTQPTYLIVKSTLPAEAKDIADIHDSERLPTGFPWGLPLLLAAGLAVWQWLRRRARRPETAPPAEAPRTIPADEAALARLLELENAGLIAAGRSREFAFILSEIQREYLAHRFGIDALEATTTELLERAVALPLTDDRHAWLRDACAELDGVKFATGVMSARDAARLLRDTRALVQATPVPVSTVNTGEQGTGAGTTPDTAGTR